MQIGHVKSGALFAALILVTEVFVIGALPAAMVKLVGGYGVPVLAAVVLGTLAGGLFGVGVYLRGRPRTPVSIVSAWLTMLAALFVFYQRDSSLVDEPNIFNSVILPAIVLTLCLGMGWGRSDGSDESSDPEAVTESEGRSD